MIDFTNAIEKLNHYKGSEKKKTLLYENKKYLVKFPDPIQEKNKNISYINNAFSEFVGSHIFQLVGIPVQNTILGKYNYREKEKIVCACEDFTDIDTILYEFQSFALSVNPDKKIETELSDIMEVIEESKMISSELTKQKFWDMFVIDSLIGNTDRHNGNWGFLFHKNTEEVTFSPIYDCGSSFNPMLEEEEIAHMSAVELKNLALNCYSCLKENGKRIHYTSYLKEMKNEECNAAVKRIFGRISIEKIDQFIDSIECISKVRKGFYKQLIGLRYQVLKEVYEILKSVG